VSTANQYYTSEEQISVAKYSPYLPVVLMERTTRTVKAPSTTTSCTLTSAIGNIKIGDIITDNNKASGVTEQITTLVTVQRIDNSTPASPIIYFNTTLSSAITVGAVLDFSRPSMTNKADPFLSNNSRNNDVSATQTTGAVIRIDDFQFGGLPRYGDRVTVVSGSGAVPVDAIVLSFVISYSGGKTRVVLTMSENTTLTGDEVIDIARNPEFDSNF
jgi:hypothetical protein